MKHSTIEVVPGFTLHDLNFVEGESFIFSLDADIAPGKVKSYAAFVEGNCRVLRVRGRLVDERGAGHTTGKSPWRPEVPMPNKLLYTVLTPTFRYVCLNRNDGVPPQAVDHELAPGQSLTIAAGRFGLLVVGSAILADEPVQPVTVIPEGATVQALDNTLVLEVVK